MADRNESGDALDKLGAAALELALLPLGLPGISAAAEPLLKRVRAEISRSRSTALAAAEERAGLRREDIAEQIAEDPRLVPLVIRMLYAAGMTGHDRTLKALGGVFGRAVQDRSSVDECELILTALADLTGNHAATLLLLSEDPPELSGHARVWTPDLLARSSDLPPHATSLCLAALVARGLADAATGVGGVNVCRITALGYEVLNVLHAYSER